MPPGRMKHRLTFGASAEQASDDLGNTIGPVDDQFTRWAEVIPLKGGESVLAARLKGTQPVIIKVWLDKDTTRITPDWQARDSAGTIYALHSVADMEQRGQQLTIMAEAGVAP